MFSDEDVSREFGNNNTESRGIYGLLNIFPPYFLNLIQDFYHLKEEKKRIPWPEYIRNEKEKLNKRSKLASATDISVGKQFQI